MTQDEYLNLHPAERQRLFYDALGLINNWTGEEDE